MQAAAIHPDAAADKAVRVLIVDDSIATRRLIAVALSSESSLDVVGYAPDGRAALEKIERLRPDVVTLDIEMPVMDGLETLREIRRRFPRVRVVMLSSLTRRGGQHTLEALNLGAHDYVAKGGDGRGFDDSLEALRSELIPKLLQFFVRDPTPPTAPRAAQQAPSQPRRLPKKVDIVAIGISTGGPNALADVLPKLPADFPCPILITQHMPPTFTRLLAERLDQSCAIRVEEAEPGAKLTPGKALVAAGGHHLIVRRRGVDVIADFDDGPPENSCRPAVDVMYRSIASVYGGSALAVIMTGMGHDGAAGAGVLRQQGAAVVVQDRDSSVVWGMPGRVVELGLADEIVGLDRIAPTILQYI